MLPDDSAAVTCPYCGETVEVLLDLGGGPVQEYVEDCEVCCRPWVVRVTLGYGGQASVVVERLEGE
ncbi:MAG: CPXCG motif-containing cysteine-rich protein [Gemmatimonadota bacterium]